MQKQRLELEKIVAAEKKAAKERAAEERRA